MSKGPSTAISFLIGLSMLAACSDSSEVPTEPETAVAQATAPPMAVQGNGPKNKLPRDCTSGELAQSNGDNTWSCSGTAGSLDAWEIVESFIDLTDVETYTAVHSALCPTGKVVTGGGYEIVLNELTDDLIVDIISSYPTVGASQNVTAWQVIFRKLYRDPSAIVGLRVHAICANG